MNLYHTNNNNNLTQYLVLNKYSKVYNELTALHSIATWQLLKKNLINSIRSVITQRDRSKLPSCARFILE